MSTLTEGSRLGRYRILRRLGAGAMGEVYLAEDPQIGRRLAIKTVRVEEGRPREVEERKQRLLREARAAGKLLHPQVVTLFDAGEDQGVLYLAFEWVEGSDLDHRLAEGPPLTLAEALSIARQAAEGLDAAHRQGVVHRDIKPSNLMLTADGRVKVADFGIAKVVDSTSDLTMSGSVVGSPHYLSPEQVRGEALDGRTDIFSLGVMLYEILCQRRPFEGDTLTTLVYQILHREPTPISERRPDLGPRLERLITRMMHKDREQRFATAAEVAAEISACERELSPAALGGAAAPSEPTLLLPPEPSTAMRSTPQPTPTPPPPPPAAAALAPAGRSRWIALAVAGLAVLGLILAVGLGARRWAAGRAAAPARPATPAATLPAESRGALPEGVAGSPPAGSVAAPAEPDSPAAEPAPARVEAASTPAPPPPFVPGARGAAPLAAAAPTAPAPSPPAAVVSAPPPPAPPAAASVPAAPETAAPAPEAAATAPEAAAAEPASEPVASTAPVAAAARELRDAFVASLPVAREMETAMALSLEVQPKEVAERVVVRLDRIVLGRAADWNASRRGGRAYSVPEPGLHILSFHVDGAEVYRLRIDAQPGRGGPTKIAVDLPGQARRPRRRPGGQ